ncbi:MAG: helix-turn-helix transcriptional regulator [Dehalococcoidia bacterium]
MNRLKEVRNERGVSQLRLAMLTGISPGDISRIENDWLRPYAGWRKRLARALGKTEAELFPAEKGGQDGQ